MTVINRLQRSSSAISVTGEDFSQQQLQEFVDAEIDAQVLLLPAGDGFRISHANAAARLLFGGSDTLPDIRPVVTQCRLALAEELPANLTDVRWPGEHRWFDVRVRLLYGQVSVILTDVTQRHTATDALIDSQCRYRLLAENAGDLVFQVRGKRLEWVSASVRQLLGWTQSDVVGRRVVEFVHPDDQSCVLSACQVDSTSSRYEARFRHRDGHWVWLSVAMRPAEDLGGCLARIGSGRAMSA